MLVWDTSSCVKLCKEMGNHLRDRPLTHRGEAERCGLKARDAVALEITKLCCSSTVHACVHINGSAIANTFSVNICWYLQRTDDHAVATRTATVVRTPSLSTSIS